MALIKLHWNLFLMAHRQVKSIEMYRSTLYFHHKDGATGQWSKHIL